MRNCWFSNQGMICFLNFNFPLCLHKSWGRGDQDKELGWNGENTFLEASLSWTNNISTYMSTWTIRAPSLNHPSYFLKGRDLTSCLELQLTVYKKFYEDQLHKFPNWFKQMIHVSEWNSEFTEDGKPSRLLVPLTYPYNSACGKSSKRCLRYFILYPPVYYILFFVIWGYCGTQSLLESN